MVAANLALVLKKKRSKILRSTGPTEWIPSPSADKCMGIIRQDKKNFPQEIVVVITLILL